jgi:hypothetical protein
MTELAEGKNGPDWARNSDSTNLSRIRKSLSATSYNSFENLSIFDLILLRDTRYSLT